ncbi:cytochrome c1 [Vreelandella zhanjiangensis]|uniref:cytochrome c1 n=1 Tax=Vreelandella zhanjiangensis TaxID=1121960 RepID=UPI0003A58736
MKHLWIVVCFLLMPIMAVGGQGGRELRSGAPDLQDQASLQNGLKLYVNYCLGCHTLSYQRFSRTANDLNIPQALMEDAVMFSSAAAFDDPMHNALRAEEAAQWWGVAPPDLSLTVRLRGADWVNAFLLGFYQDSDRPNGVNNTLFDSVAMPNVLEPLQGVQVLDCSKTEQQECDRLKVITPGLMAPDEFESAVYDITNFLAYVSEPYRLKAQAVAPKVMIFLFIFGVIAYFLKREYWKDVY